MGGRNEVKGKLKLDLLLIASWCFRVLQIDELKTPLFGKVSPKVTLHRLNHVRDGDVDNKTELDTC